MVVNAKILICNNCKEELAVKAKNKTDARTSAYKLGWMSFQPYDFCKRCSREHIEMIGEVYGIQDDGN